MSRFRFFVTLRRLLVLVGFLCAVVGVIRTEDAFVFALAAILVIVLWTDVCPKCASVLLFQNEPGRPLAFMNPLHVPKACTKCGAAL